MENNEHPDHTHECRNCGGSIDCWTPNDECDDYPGDCCEGESE